MIKKYVLFIAISALAASVALARLNPKDDPNLRSDGASTPSFADQIASFVAIAASLNSGTPSSTSLSPATSEVSDENSHIQLSGNSNAAASEESSGEPGDTEI